jgi:CRP/FNR family transcriptional regulator, polysaccharide utilization system transcription regulator
MVRHITCTECSVCARGPFGCLTGPQLTRLMESRIPHSYAPNQPLFYEGNPPFAVYCIREGTIKLWRNGHGGDQHVIRTRSKGDLVGARAALARRPYTVTAEPLGPFIACTIPSDIFISLVEENPALANRLLRKLAVETIETEDAMVDRALYHVRQRTARFLLHLVPADSGPSDQPLVLRLPWSREEMAHLIGTTSETLSRTLHAFAAQKVLDIKRREIRLLDVASLRRTAR